MIALKKPLSIATLNVRGLGERRKQYQLSRLLNEKGIDILAVQETKIESEERTDLMVRPFANRYSVCVSHALGTSAGCCLFVKNAIGIEIGKIYSCESGRQVTCELSYCGSQFFVICMYAPNKVNERKVFFETIANKLQDKDNVVLLGDFNCVCAREDRADLTRNRDPSARLLQNILDEHDLTDVAHCAAKADALRYTHFQGDSHARLDRICFSWISAVV